MRINIVRPFLPKLEEIQKDFAECLSTGMVTNGSKHVRAFEEKIGQFFEIDETPVAFCNGEMALYNLIFALKLALGYGAHDSFNVLVPSFTFSGTVNAIVANNLKPVFCDVDDTLTLDLKSIKKVPANTKMIMPVGAYGNLVDLDALSAFAKNNGLAVALDNAPAFGSRYKGKFPWQHGFSEIYSFHASKIFNCMEGGAALTADNHLAEIMRQLRDFGQYEKVRGDVDSPGLNSKMQEISALVGLRNLEKIGYILETRRKRVDRYHAFFRDLESRGILKTMRVDGNVHCTYLYYPVILNEDATRFVEHMAGRDIAVRRYYTAVHSLKYYRGKYEELGLAFTNEIKDRVVALPIHTEMSEEEMKHLFESVDGYFAARKS